MSVERLLSTLAGYGARTALIWRDRAFDYRWLVEEVTRLAGVLEAEVPPGSVVALCADYSPRSLAALLALWRHGAVVSPITGGFLQQKAQLLELAEAQREIEVDGADDLRFTPLAGAPSHPLLVELIGRGRGGLVLFSSGSAGKVKAVVHDAARLLEKYSTPRRASVTIPFMLFDHIGGLNTILHTLSSGGTAVLPEERSPEAICRLIERHRVQVLPATPTFLNLLLLSDHAAFDLGSLETLAYGAERMPEAALARLAEAFPKVQLLQNYGLSEAGILHTRSRSSDSLWMKVGGDGVQVRVRDGLLEVKAETAMLGYLNEASPFTEDGWLKTGDRVEVEGEYLRVLGRQSDLIIIGGEKVYPAEVEDLIAEMDGVLDVVVTGEANALTGQIVRAKVQLASAETRADFRGRLMAFLGPRLPPFKIPQRVEVTTEPLHSARWKKRRV